MYWELRCTKPMAAGEAPENSVPAAGRYVLHRHHDAAGPHLDLRLEQDGYLMGWRIEGVSLDAAVWGTEKAPHSVRWLEQDGDAIREDAGVYAWVERSPDGGELELRGREGVRRVRVERRAGLPICCVRSLSEAMTEHGLEADALAGLIADGVVARGRAVARFCGLGRELDGSAFDEQVWRDTLASRSLEEIQAHLRALEVRFDAKYPPQPVSKPERLEDEAPARRCEEVLAMLEG